MDFVIPGRRVSVVEFNIRATYAGALEGTPEGLSRLYRDNGLAETVMRQYSPVSRLPVDVIDPGTPALPPAQCIANFCYLESDCSRHLLASWFVPDMDVRVSDAIRAVLSRIDWARARKVMFEDY